MELPYDDCFVGKRRLCLHLTQLLAAGLFKTGLFFNKGVGDALRWLLWHDSFELDLQESLDGRCHTWIISEVDSHHGLRAFDAQTYPPHHHLAQITSCQV